MNEDRSTTPSTEPTPAAPPAPPAPVAPQPDPPAKEAKPAKPPAQKKHLTEEEAALKPRTVVTVKEAKVLFRKSIFTDEDLIRKSGMGRSSVDRFWKGDLPKNGMAWRGIAGLLEQILVDHVKIKS